MTLSSLGCFACALLTDSDDEIVLKKPPSVCHTVRPWGSYRQKVLAVNPGLQRNRDFMRDIFNIAVGTDWQVSLVGL